MATSIDARAPHDAGELPGEQAPAPAAGEVDAEQLERELRLRIKGEVRFDAGSRALYATDGSNYRQVPIGVVVPRDEDDVIVAVSLARRFGAPVLARGGGTSLAGQCCNVALVIDMSKYMNRVLWVDPERRLARVQPGAILDRLRDAAEEHGLTFGPDPSTHNHCTLGGMIGNNSCGVHAQMAGRTADNVHELDVLLYDGTRLTVGATDDAELARIIQGGGRAGAIYSSLRRLRDRYAERIRERYPQIPRRVSGYNLDELLPERGFQVARALVGTEGTCAIVLGATVRLVPSPQHRILAVLGFEDVATSAELVPRVVEFEPTGLEGIDGFLVSNMRKKGLHPEDTEMLPNGESWLLVEFGGDTAAEAKDRAQRALAALEPDERVVGVELLEDPEVRAKIWEIRESGLGATARVPGEDDTWPGWEDSAVPPDRLGDYLRELQGLYHRYGYSAALYGHFGQGCVHTRINFDLLTAQGIAKWRAFMEDATDLVVRYGGSLSGEHGDGQSRAEFLPKLYGDELIEAFRDFKSAWDPAWKLNPGKVVEPYRMEENMRLGTTFEPPDWKTYFQFPDDEGSFIRGALRCVGVGMCRRLDGDSTGSQTMCPSFMVTREEQHSTRGRAHLLFEMLRGDSVMEGWHDDAVHEALDLCLACKGCKSDCPVNVDMATYKAEFSAHYYQGRLRPITAYTLGLIYWWARLASKAPWAANLATQTPGLRWVAKRLAGVATQRSLPRFAPTPFRELAGTDSAAGDASRPKVILWADTFNNFFFPGPLAAAKRALEDAGYRVEVPRRSLCCGRPLYDYGMLGTAKQLLRQTLTDLHDEIAAGTPVVGVEPSCVSVFRDELTGLFPRDYTAQRLSAQTYVLSEFLVKVGYRPPRLEGTRAVVHGHCHQKAVLDFRAEQELLDRMSLDYEVLNSGCCGMAGSFGFESSHYEISQQIGEHSLFPAVRGTDSATLVITNGFSCREQIGQGTQREALTVGEVIALAIDRRDAARAAAPVRNDGREAP